MTRGEYLEVGRAANGDMLIRTRILHLLAKAFGLQIKIGGWPYGAGGGEVASRQRSARASDAEVERQYRLLTAYWPAAGLPHHETFAAARQTLAWLADPNEVMSPAAVLIGGRVDVMNYDGLTATAREEASPVIN